MLDRKSLREVHDFSRVPGHASIAYADQTRAIVGMSINKGNVMYTIIGLQDSYANRAVSQ
jgi:hypothetical protein